LAELLDLWADNSQGFSRDGIRASELQKKPSDHLLSNVRVTPFVFERVDVYLDRYDLADVLCFSTDYPPSRAAATPWVGSPRCSNATAARSSRSSS